VIFFLALSAATLNSRVDFPTPGSPAYEEWRKKQDAKNKDLNVEENNEGSVATEEPKGQRKQPKKKRRK